MTTSKGLGGLLGFPGEANFSATIDHESKRETTAGEDVEDWVDGLLRQTHSATAILLAQRLENVLRKVIEAHMPNANPDLFKRGALRSFYAKIEVAHALGYIADDERVTLHTVRRIRNEFAHTDVDLHFDNPTVVALLDELPYQETTDESGAKSSLFIANVNALHEVLDARPTPVGKIVAALDGLS